MSKELTPEVIWAQRSSADDETKNIVYLTINVPDIENDKLELKLTPTTLTYNGVNKKGVTYHLEVEFYAEIDPEESKKVHTPRDTFCVIRKKEKKVEFWPRLQKDSKKAHWLKTDFDRWADEDEQEGEPAEPGFDPSMMSQFGGGEDAGGFGGIDFSKLGAGQDLSGLKEGMGDADSDDGDDDEEMPDLEPPKEDAAAAGGSKKIEEVA